MESAELHEFREQFEDNLDQVFEGFHLRLRDAFEREKINRLYSLARYQIPKEVQHWGKKETGQYHLQVVQAITQMIEDEETRHSTVSTQQRQLLERIYTRLKYPRVLEETGLGPNNVFYQGFGAFGLTGGSLFVLLSFFPYSGKLYLWIRCISSVIVGLYYGVIVYRKYEQAYRNVLFLEGEKYLYENKKRIREWFEQIIAVCEDASKLCIK